jgi:beta-N-acetylhexosaminidase
MKRLLLTLSLVLFPFQALAVTPATSHILNRETNWYDPSDTGSVCPTTGTTSPSASAAALPAGTTADQQIAQTFIVGFDAGTPKATIEALFTKYHLGGMYLTGTNNAAAAGFNAAFYAKLGTDAGVPIVASSDEEGVVSRYSYPAGSFPPAASMGANAQKIGTDAGAVMKTNGLTTDLAPVLDLRDVGTGLTGRSFSNNPTTVAAQAGAFAAGLDASGITPIFKHFPGFDSTTSGSTDDVKVVMTGSVANTTAPYKTLVAKFPNAGVMMSNMYVNALDSANPTSLSAKSVAYLRGTIGFQGMITTDDLAVRSVTAATGSLASSVTKSLDAGVTMPLFANPSDAGMQAIINQVKATVAPASIAAADTQVLSFKNSKTSTAVGTTGCCPTGAGSTTGSGTPADLKGRQQKVWDALRAAGFGPIQVAGIMGNMNSEDGTFEPNLVEGMTHADVPPVYASGSSDQPPGYGIVQWTPGPELIPLATPPALVHDLGWQLNILINQITKPGSPPVDRSQTGPDLKAATTVAAAVEVFRADFERNLSGPQPDRVTAANKFLAEFGSSVPATTTLPTTTQPGVTAPITDTTSTATTTASTCGTPTGNLAPGALAWPITTKATITQCFVVGGHVGLDIAYTDGTPIFAAAAGTVVLAGGNDAAGYGLQYVAIQHSTQFFTSYGHMGTMSVKAGDVVKQGQQIGTEDNQGSSTGSHLHFNVYSGTAAAAAAAYYNGNVDPLTNGLAIPPGVPNPNGCK